jgi:predicted double-glycine peptidase
MFTRNVLRVKEGVMYTPVYEFDHPVTKSNVALAGAIHIGEPPYYQTITDYLLRQEGAGAEIHYEMVKPPTEHEQASYSDVVLAAAELQGGLRFVFELMADSLDAVHQKDAVAYQASWHNYDISVTEIIRLLGDENAQELIQKLKELEQSFQKIKENISADTLQLLMRGITRAMPTLSILKDLGIIGDKHLDKIIVDHRNDVALNAVRETLDKDPDQDIALLWGAGHIPGLKSGLEQLGYRTTTRRWLGAFALKK